jgi:subtilisin-like proprotein convertase family protein
MASTWSAGGSTPPKMTPARQTESTLTGDGALVAALQSGAARPVGLASADFDRDGVGDVAAFFVHGKQAVVVVHRGNPDAYDPYTLEAIKHRGGALAEATPPFLGEARVFGAPVAPDFFGTGDFDNDGRADVLVASKGASTFTVLPGDGAGGFGEPLRIDVGGKLQALAVGYVNREDGIADVVAAVETQDGPLLRVYESPEGALPATPETIALPASASALVVGDLQGDHSGDVVALTRRELLIVQGRDRHLGETVDRAASVGPATVERRKIDVDGRSLTLGRFANDAVMDIVVIDSAGAAYRTPGQRAAALDRLDEGGASRGAVTAHVSRARRDDLVVLGEAPSARLKTGSGFDFRLGLAAAPVAALAVPLNDDAGDDLVLLDEDGRGQLTTTQLAPTAVFFVTTTADGGFGSLRQAITDANLIGGTDQIHFSIPGPGPYLIATASPLPTITGTVTIDGRTQPGWSAKPIVFVDGTASGAGCGLCFAASGADGSGVLGLGVRGFPGDGIRFDDVWVSVVDECYLGTDFSGTVAVPNVNGVAVRRSRFDRIGNVVGNLISGNSNDGVYLEGGLSASFYSSVDVPKPIPDLSTTLSTLTATLGAVVEDVNVTLDLSHTFDSDLVLTLISPTGLSVQLASGVGGSGDNFSNTTFDDEAGTPIAAGTAPFTGSFIPASPLSAFDGGPVDGTWTLEVKDTVGGDVGTLNSWSLLFQNRTDGNSVQRNRIGTDASGSFAVPNYRGVHVFDEASDRIGGTGATDGNLISGNVQSGVWIEGARSRGHRVEGNRVGTNAAGSAALGNGSYGIVLVSGPNGNTVGGTAAGAGNLVAAHPQFGIASQTVRENRYQGNLVGTNVTGSAAIPNATAFAGFDIRQELIGGSAPGARNVFSGSSATGVYLAAFGGGGGNSVVGNYIGTNVSGSAALGNFRGVELFEDGDQLNDNVISGNTDSGVYIPSVGHILSGNRIGVDTAAASRISNKNGVYILGGRSNAIGAPFSPPNTIAGNLEDGVHIEGSPVFSSVTYNSLDVPKAILDVATITSTLFVPDDGAILDLDVRIDLTHTFDSDLAIALIDPFGRRIPLAQNRGGGGDNYSGTTFDDEAGTSIASGAAPFSGSFRPEQPLAYLDGRTLFGTWTLQIADQVGGDVGTLNAWQMTVSFAGPLNNQVSSNFIGTNSLGSAGLENVRQGVHVLNAARNTVGGFLGGNTISGNAWGVLAEGSSSSENAIQFNVIGATSTKNFLGGVMVDGGLGNDISRNTVQGNFGPGVFAAAGYNNSIQFNSMQDNTGLGIDLTPFSVNANDLTDSDAGANDLQNYPVITSLIPLGPNNQLGGTLNTEPNREYQLDFYSDTIADPSGHGEGAGWLGNMIVNSGPTGIVPFAFVAAAGVGFYSVTATGPGGSTSEFSGAFALPQEVPDTMQAAKVGPDLKLTYTPACGASDHAVFWGLSPIVGGLSWTNAQCAFGVSGVLTFNPGVPAAGKFFYFVVVGQTFSLEGSYGQNKAGTERPEAIGLFVCEQPQSLGGPCP